MQVMITLRTANPQTLREELRAFADRLDLDDVRMTEIGEKQKQTPSDRDLEYELAADSLKQEVSRI